MSAAVCASAHARRNYGRRACSSRAGCRWVLCCCSPSLASKPAKPDTMPAEWPKLLRAARASRQVAGLPLAQARAWGNLRLAHWPISGSRVGRPSRGASQVGLFQRPKSVQRSRRSIVTAPLTITRLQKRPRFRPAHSHSSYFRGKWTRARSDVRSRDSKCTLSPARRRGGVTVSGGDRGSS